jgi:hypothetical protein
MELEGLAVAFLVETVEVAVGCHGNLSFREF